MKFMRYKRILSIVMVLTLLIAFPAIAQNGEVSDTTDEGTQPDVAAVVNDEEISVQELQQYAGTQNLIMTLYQSFPEFTQVLLQTEPGQGVLEEFQKIKLDQLINEKLLAQEAKERDLELDQEEMNEIFNQQIEGIKEQNNMDDAQLEEALKQQGIESLEAYKETFFEMNKDQLLINKLKEDIENQAEVSDEEVKAYYDENQDSFKVQEQAAASHILLEDKETAEEVLQKVKDGGDFAELAKEYSTGPSAEQGGELGMISRGSSVAQEFKDAVFALKVGGVSPVVETQYGFHVIKVTDRKEAGVQSFEEVKENIREQLLNQKSQELWSQFQRELRDKAKIEKKL